MSDLVIPGRGGVLTSSEAKALGNQFARELAAKGRVGQLMVTGTNFARCYVYSGEWVADCPRQHCGNTVLMTVKEDKDRNVAWTPYETLHSFDCGYCGYHTDSVHWPANYELILDVLDCRPIPHTRNWYPEGHPTAVKTGVVDGETPADLVRENTEHQVPTPDVLIDQVKFVMTQSGLERGEPWRGLSQ